MENFIIVNEDQPEVGDDKNISDFVDWKIGIGGYKSVRGLPMTRHFYEIRIRKKIYG